MEFNDFIKNGKVRKGEKDVMLAKSLVNAAKQDLEFLESLEVNELSARKIFSNYYDTLRTIIEAMAALDGFKIYSHEAFTFYLKDKNEENSAMDFDRFRKIRNRINYYGKEISKEEVLQHKGKIKKLIKSLQNKYLSE